MNIFVTTIVLSSITTLTPLATAAPPSATTGDHIFAQDTTQRDNPSNTGINPCPADINSDGNLNFFDVSAFLFAFSSQNPLADFTGDGDFNFFDVSEFLSAFAAGCPSGCSSGYPPQETSQYNLPYLPDSAYLVGQGNCTDGSHETGTFQAYAYDFDMPIGTPLVATRAGTVIVVVEHFADNTGIPGQENYLIIQHADGRISGYYHLTQNGIDVNLGASVAQGDVVARSGNSGDSSKPHVHFEVAECEDCDTLPTNFKNTREHINGLIEGQSYLAE